MRHKFWLVSGAIFFALLLFGWQAQAVEVGQPAPSLVLQQLDGQAFDLAALKGKVVVINFWATWCAPCRAEMPELDNFYQHHHAKNLVMIGLSADSARHEDEVKDVMRAYRFPAAILNDASTNGFGAPKEIPVTYVIDREGIVRAKLTPDQTPLTEKNLLAVVQPLLAP